LYGFIVNKEIYQNNAQENPKIVPEYVAIRAVEVVGKIPLRYNIEYKVFQK
jgi:hypothetical protein